MLSLVLVFAGFLLLRMKCIQLRWRERSFQAIVSGECCFLKALRANDSRTVRLAGPQAIRAADRWIHGCAASRPSISSQRRPDINHDSPWQIQMSFCGKQCALTNGKTRQSGRQRVQSRPVNRASVSESPLWLTRRPGPVRQRARLAPSGIVQTPSEFRLDLRLACRCSPLRRANLLASEESSEALAKWRAS